MCGLKKLQNCDCGPSKCTYAIAQLSLNHSAKVRKNIGKADTFVETFSHKLIKVLFKRALVNESGHNAGLIREKIRCQKSGETIPFREYLCV
jgi:hypothetical protein